MRKRAIGDSPLIKRIMYVGCSRANAYLQVAIMDDTDLKRG